MERRHFCRRRRWELPCPTPTRMSALPKSFLQRPHHAGRDLCLGRHPSSKNIPKGFHHAARRWPVPPAYAGETDKEENNPVRVVSMSALLPRPNFFLNAPPV